MRSAVLPTRIVPARTLPTGDLDSLAHVIARDGVNAHDQAVLAVVSRATLVDAAGLAVLLTVLADPTAPDIARQRAFGRVASALASSRTPTVHMVTTADQPSERPFAA